jgi:serine phosphatase RsbU (regulator of sigma subunit)/DNA-binding response OmpR family regulator
MIRQFRADEMAETYSILFSGLNTSESAFVSTHFSRLSHEVILAGNPTEARESLRSRKIDLLYLRPSADNRAVEELAAIAGPHPSLPVVLVCAQAAQSLVLDAWRAGAADILFLPLTAQSLNASLQRGARRMLPRENAGTTPVGGRFFYLDEAGKECWAGIHPPRFTLGRGAGNSLSFGQMGVSRSHAEVLMQGGEYLLRDLGSKLGTYVNGARVEQARLTDGDRVQLGGSQGTTLVFHAGDILQSLLSSSEAKAEIGLSIRGFRDVGKLFAAFRAFSTIPVLDDLLALVVDTAIELTGAERGFIMLKEQNGDLSFRCARNDRRRPLDGSLFRTSQRVPHDVFKTGRPVVIKDLDFGDGAESHNFTRQLGLRSISCVPLRYLTVHESGTLSAVGQAETIGVLYVDSENVGAGLSHARVDALETLASEAAMAIYNARLYKDSQDKRRMEEQLAVAREIQQALLPQPNRSVEYAQACSQSLPCYEIGGDYFDYFDLEDGRLGFALGDVAGKGMPAALLASLVQGIFSAQTLFSSPLPAIMGNVNRNLVLRGTGNRFVTFFFGILDADGNCTYVNAGHNPPFLLARDGSMKELTEGGMVLGLFAAAQYEAATLRLQPGDHLVLFTDGVVEALNTAGEEFGTDRLVALLRANAQASASEILARLQEAVLAFSAHAPQHDDITMMILGYREPR